MPECLEDCVGEDSPVRVIVAFVEELDLQALGLEGMDAASPVSPPLKLYICGYLNGIQSSRRLSAKPNATSS